MVTPATFCTFLIMQIPAYHLHEASSNLPTPPSGSKFVSPLQIRQGSPDLVRVTLASFVESKLCDGSVGWLSGLAQNADVSALISTNQQHHLNAACDSL